MGSAVASISAVQICFHWEIAKQEDKNIYLNRKTGLPGVYERHPGGQNRREYKKDAPEVCPICSYKCNRQKRGGRKQQKLRDGQTKLSPSNRTPTHHNLWRQKFKGADGNSSEESTFKRKPKFTQVKTSLCKGTSSKTLFWREEGCQHLIN